MFLCVLIVDLRNVLENTLEPIGKFWEFDGNILRNTKNFKSKAFNNQPWNCLQLKPRTKGSYKG